MKALRILSELVLRVMRIKTFFLASIFISFGFFGTGSTKPIDFDQGWYQFLKKPLKRHFYSSNQVPINGSILLDKLRDILLLENNKDQLFMEAGRGWLEVKRKVLLE